MIQLSKADLLEWSGWKRDAKKFLGSCGPEIPILPVVRRAGEGLLRLHITLIENLRTENFSALHDANQLVVRANAVAFGGDERQARAFMTSTLGAPFEPSPDTDTGC